MAKKQINFIVDTMQQSYGTIGTFKQLDSVFFNVQIIEQGVAKDLTGQTLKLYINKADKTVVEQKSGIEIVAAKEGKITIDLLNSALQAEGFAVGELNISDAAGSISTVNFNFRVCPTVASDDFIESTNEIGTLKEVEVYVVQAKKEIQDFKKLQEQMLLTNNNLNTQEATRVSNELLRQSDEEVRQAQENARGIELKDSRTDFWGKEHENLSARLNSDAKNSNDNLKFMFLEQKGTGSLTVKNTIEGAVKDLKVFGNTVGGYNSETSTSFPMVSVGQAESGLLTIRTCGKNLLNPNGNYMKDCYLNANDERIPQGGSWVLEDFIKTNPDKSYKLYFKDRGHHTLRLYGYDLSKKRIQTVAQASTPEITITGCDYIRCSVLEYTEVVPAFKPEIVMLEEGSISTDYEAYKESVAQVQLPFEGGLKGLPDVVSDEFKINSGLVLQNRNRYTFNGTENFGLSKVTEEYAVFTHRLFSAKGSWNMKGDICNMFIQNNTTAYNGSGEAFAIANDGLLWLSVLKSKASNEDELKAWLVDKNLTFEFGLKTPIIHKISPQSLSTFKSLTTLAVESEVAAGIEGKFPCEVGGVLTDLQEENKILKEENREFKETFTRKLEEVDMKFARLSNAKI